MRGTRTASAWVTVAFAFIASVTPARAFHDQSLPTLAEGSTPGPGWVAHRVHLDGDEFEIGINARVDQGFQAGGVYLDASGESLGWFWILGVPNEEGIVLDSHLPAGELHLGESERGSLDGWRFGTEIAFNCGACQKITGTFTFILWIGGDVFDLRWLARGAPGLDLAGTTYGDEAFLYRSDDFAGAANARGYRDGVGARANVANHVTHRVERSLFGFFTSFTSANVMTVEGPSGTRVCAEDPAGSVFPACLFTSSAQPAGPGDYTFTLTGAGAGLTGIAEAFAGGADVVLP